MSPVSAPQVPKMGDLFNGYAQYDLFRNGSGQVNFEQLKAFEKKLRALQGDDDDISLLTLLSLFLVVFLSF